MSDAARYQALYDNLVAWLDSHGISVAGLWAEHFNVRWLLTKAQYVTGRIYSTLAFWLITLTYVILGLLEVDDVRRKVETLRNRAAARVIIDGSAATAVKFRKYLLVRTQMSVLTGLVVGLFGIGAVVLLQILFTYATPLQRLFDTEAVPLWVWPWLVAAGFVFFLVVEAEKLTIRSVDSLRRTVTAVEAGA